MYKKKMYHNLRKISPKKKNYGKIYIPIGMVFSYLFCVLYAYDYLCTYFKRYPSSIFANSAYRYCIFDQKLRTLGEYYSWCRTAFVRYARNPFFKRFNNCVICMYIIPMYRYDQSFVLKHQS